MSYITATALAEYLLAKGYVSDALEDTDASRLRSIAIEEWEGLVGVRPFVVESETVKTFDPTDIQADRRGWILDLPTPLAAIPSLVKSGISGDFAGTTLTQWDGWETPDTAAPWTQLIFRQRPYRRLQITASWGYYTSEDSVTEFVNDAIRALAAARCTEELQGAQGKRTRETTGIVTVESTDPVRLLRERALDIAIRYRLS